MSKINLNSVGMHILLLIGVGILIYSNTFQVPFVFDDESSIVNNQVIHDLSKFMSGAGYSYNPRRVVGYFTFAMNYRLGGLNVSGYHVFNLGVHLGAGLLVYALALLIFQTPVMRESRLFSKASLVALLAALLFVAHPIQTQAVTYIVQRLASLATLFYLLSMVLYVKGRLRAENPAEGFAQKMGFWRTGAPCLAGSLFAAVLAMKTKEIAFTLPFAVLLSEIAFFRGAWRKRLAFIVPLLLTLPIVPLSTFGGGGSAAELLADVSDRMQVQAGMTWYVYLLTQFRVIATYLRLLVLPVNQNLDYDYPGFSSFFSPQVFLSFLLLAGIAMLGLYLLFSRCGLCGGRRLQGFGILWFFLTISVQSSVIPTGDVIFEHRLYLPFVGACVAASGGFFLLIERYRSAFAFRLSVVVAVLIGFTLSAATYRRNQVWSSSVTLWQDAVRKSPGKVRPYNNLGASLNDAGRVAEAIPVLSAAIKVKPDHSEAYYNLGRSFLLTGRNIEAAEMMLVATRLKPDYYDAYVNLTAAYLQTGRFHDVVRIIESHLDQLGRRADARFNLGVAAHCLGDDVTASRELTLLRQLDGQYAAQLEAFMGRPFVGGVGSGRP